jgi:hypothetical protein
VANKEKGTGMHKVVAVLVVVLAGSIACEKAEYDWGDATSELSHNWCEMRDRCMQTNEFDVCYRHNMHHLCELRDICNVAMSEPVEELSLCANALAEIVEPDHPACFGAQYGIVPTPCDALLFLSP